MAKIKYTQFREIPQYIGRGRYHVDMSMTFLVKWIENQQNNHDPSGSLPNLQLRPDFQRDLCWTAAEQVSYIEFVLRGGRTSRELYFNCPGWFDPIEPGGYNEFVLVDGLQRITAVQAFVNNEIKAFGSYRKEYTDIERGYTNLQVNINYLGTKALVLEWYLQINAMGRPHAPAEIKRVRKLLKKESGG